jgi:hypothetical protein
MKRIKDFVITLIYLICCSILTALILIGSIGLLNIGAIMFFKHSPILCVIFTIVVFIYCIIHNIHEKRS